jgi:hypothetical protein
MVCKPSKPEVIVASLTIREGTSSLVLKHWPSLINQPGAFGSVAFRLTSFSAGNLHARFQSRDKASPSASTSTPIHQATASGPAAGKVSGGSLAEA